MEKYIILEDEDMKIGDLFIVTSNNFDDRIYKISKIEDNYKRRILWK